MSMSASNVFRVLPCSTCQPEGMSTATSAGTRSFLLSYIAFKSLTIVPKGSRMSPAKEKPKIASMII